MAAKASLLLGPLFLFVLFSSLAVHATETEQKDAFHFIKQLEGAHKGQHVEGLNEIKRYLKKFGYLNVQDSENDEFDNALESAIRAYQINFRMKVTGMMDADTVKQMMRPRCGVTDALNAIKIDQPRFYATHITYRFHHGAKLTIGDQSVRSIFARAFQVWADATELTFEEVPENSPADIEIQFLGAGGPFDGPGGVFGHASRSQTSGKSSECHMDAEEKWSANPGAGEMDLESAAVHEIGHLLGLDHNTENPEAMMYPCIDNGKVKRHLHEDDIRRVHAIYGKQVE